MYDTSSRHQIYREAGYDNQRKNGICQSEKTICSIGIKWYDRRLYLRFHRRRRRNDDASDPDQCSGLRTKNRCWYQRIYYDLYSINRSGKSLYDRRYAGNAPSDPLYSLNTVMGTHCCQICKQGKCSNTQSFHRNCTYHLGRCNIPCQYCQLKIMGYHRYPIIFYQKSQYYLVNSRYSSLYCFAEFSHEKFLSISL